MASRRPQREMWSGTSIQISLLAFRHCTTEETSLTGCPHCAEQNRIVLLQFVQTAVGDVFARLFVRLGTPVVMRKVKPERLECIS